MEQNTDFDQFARYFYDNTSQKIAFSLSIFDDSVTNIYDIHTMLLDLIIYGFDYLRLQIDCTNYKDITATLQQYFNKINIKLITNNYNSDELTPLNIYYMDRYIKLYSPEKFLINGAHKKVDTLKEIGSFYLINYDTNISINFDYM